MLARIRGFAVKYLKVAAEPRTAAADPDRFVRDRLTVLAYAALGSFAFCLYGFGSVLAFLRPELRLSYPVTTLHSVLWAVGGILAGLGFRRLCAAFGRRRVLWGSIAASFGGVMLLAVAHLLTLTLVAATLLGTAGTTTLIATSAIIADRHGRHRDRALIEANAGAVSMAVAAPLVFGLLGATAIGWRAGLLVPLAGFAAIYVVFRHQPVPDDPGDPGDLGDLGDSGGTGPSLPAIFWLRASLVATNVAIEFCMVYYGAELLHAAGLHVARAATAMTLFYLGELAGRVAGARLAGARLAGARQGAGKTVPALTAAALTISTAGFAVFWLAGRSPLALAGLFVTGLGVANLYPLTLGLALSAAPGDTGHAAARVAVVTGAAIAGAPFALSLLADRWGVSTAFVLEPALIALAAGLLAAATRTGKSACFRSR